MQKDDWLLKLDLKDAYFLVPMNPLHQEFLRFRFQGKACQFLCLPFGLSCAPRVFTKLMRPVIAHLREMGFRLIIYLDDILLLCRSYVEACSQRDTLISHLHRLGFILIQISRYSNQCLEYWVELSTLTKCPSPYLRLKWSTLLSSAVEL